jgi:hypothetical protein
VKQIGKILYPNNKQESYRENKREKMPTLSQDVVCTVIGPGSRNLHDDRQKEKTDEF